MTETLVPLSVRARAIVQPVGTVLIRVVEPDWSAIEATRRSFGCAPVGLATETEFELPVAVEVPFGVRYVIAGSITYGSESFESSTRSSSSEPRESRASVQCRPFGVM